MRILPLLAGTLLGAATPAVVAAQTAVTGVVVDSLAGGAPLAGAVVQLVALPQQERVHSAVADSAGRFLIEGVAPGRYLLGFLHPRLDELLLQPPVRQLEVPVGAVYRADLAIPSGQGIAAASCRPAPGDSSALFLGRLRRVSGDTVVATTGELTIQWPEIVIASRSVRQERRTLRATADDEGRFAVCGVPTDVTVLVQASAGEASSGTVELQAPPLGLLVRDLLLARSTAGARGDSVGPARGTARLGGTVRLPNGRPVARAQVLVQGSGAADTTDATGAFTLDSLPAGTFTLEARAIGYVPRRVPVDLHPGRRASADVTLDQQVPTLDAVTIYGQRPSRRSISGFLERSRRGLGHFLTAEQIERRGAYSVPDLLRMVPGVRVQPARSFGSVITMRGAASLQGECLPAVYLDGMFIHDGATELENLVRPREVVGIEVYAGGATVPAEFQRGACGSILIWTVGRLR